MKSAIIDANIIINVWKEEINPASGDKLYVSSSKVMELVFKEKLRGILLTTTAKEVLHSVRVTYEISGGAVSFAMKKAELELSKSGMLLVIPDAGVMGMAYDLFRDLQTDPFDAIMVAAGISEKADVIISRDKKLKKKASKLIPVLTPEEFLSA